MKLLKILIQLIERLDFLNEEKNTMINKKERHFSYDVHRISSLLNEINDTEEEITEIKNNINFDNEIMELKEKIN